MKFSRIMLVISASLILLQWVAIPALLGFGTRGHTCPEVNFKEIEERTWNNATSKYQNQTGLIRIMIDSRKKEMDARVWTFETTWRLTSGCMKQSNKPADSRTGTL